MVAAPNLASKSWVTSQYDRYVLGNTVLAQPEDAGMIRIDEETGLGVAVSTDCNGRFAKLDPYAGAQLALAESYRNVAASGAVPLAVTNCLNFGSPEDPEVMWQFSQATTGLADGCLELGIPVTGGNVSFYNQTGGTAILPTPVVGVLGVIDDVERRTPMAWGPDGELIYLLGDTRDELAGSEWAHHVHGHLGGLPPVVDLGRERLLGEILVAGSRDGMLTAAHDVSDGGVAQALVEMALRSGVGRPLLGPRRHRPVRPAVQRVGRSRRRRRGAHGGAALHRDVRGSAAARDSASASSTRGWARMPASRPARRCCSSPSCSRSPSTSSGWRTRARCRRQLA